MFSPRTSCFREDGPVLRCKGPTEPRDGEAALRDAAAAGACGMVLTVCFNRNVCLLAASGRARALGPARACAAADQAFEKTCPRQRAAELRTTPLPS